MRRFGFFSYARLDDEDHDGHISELRARLERRARAVLADEDFGLYQDWKDIGFGQDWRRELDAAMGDAAFLVAVITPRFFTRPECRKELEVFVERERRLGRTDLIYPLLYLPIEERFPTDELAKVVRSRQWEDWTELRHESWKDAAVKKLLDKTATGLARGVERYGSPLPSPTPAAPAQPLARPSPSPTPALRPTPTASAPSTLRPAPGPPKAQPPSPPTPAQATQPVISPAPPTPGTILHTVDLPGAPFRLAWIPAGTFRMGSPPDVGPTYEHPQHEVRLTTPFLAGVTPVTQAQWAAVAKEAGLPPAPSHFEGADRPVEGISWHDAVRWCNALSRREGRPPAYVIGDGEEPTAVVDLRAPGYRLPTEAEWEYLCRAGSAGRWSFGETEAELGEHAWFAGNARGATHPVGTRRPNPWGLHDVHGNVWEWCGDLWPPRRYTPEGVVDPFVPPAPGGGRVLRGGSWNDDPVWCRSAYRSRNPATARNQNLGFRVVLPRPQ